MLLFISEMLHTTEQIVLILVAGIVCWKQIGAVSFIATLLVMAGIESNPGPKIDEGTQIS